MSQSLKNFVTSAHLHFYRVIKISEIMINFQLIDFLEL
jgi:hypothetical protein